MSSIFLLAMCGGGLMIIVLVLFHLDIVSKASVADVAFDS